MKKMYGLLLILAISLSTAHAQSQYTFKKVWEKEIPNTFGAEIVDLDGDGLFEIITYTYVSKREKDYLLIASDVFGDRLWEVLIDDSPIGMTFEDVDNDGCKEIFFEMDLTDYSDMMDTKKGEKRIISFDKNGKKLWSYSFEMHLGEGEDTRYYEYNFEDITKDGCKEIFVAHYVFDRKGRILHQYEEDYSIIEVSDMDNDHEVELLIRKVSHDFWSCPDSCVFQYKVIELDGRCIWEKTFTQPTFFYLVLIEGENQLFGLQLDGAFNLDPPTFEEKWRVTYDSNVRGILIPPKIDVYDLDNDGTSECIITVINTPPNFGGTALHVYDKTGNLLWEYKDPYFYSHIVDVEGDGTYEIGITYSFLETPTFFKLLDCNGNQLWNLKFDEGVIGPEIVDIDDDGEKELIFELDLENLRSKSNNDSSLEELLEKLRNADFEEKDDTKEYLYIFNAKGEIERQLEVPFQAARQDFCDLDGDGDMDALYYTSFFNEVFYCFTNTMYRGELDTLQEMGHFSDVDFGSKGFEKNARRHVRLYYEYEKIKYLLDNTYILIMNYKTEFQLFLLAVVVILGGLSVYLTRTLKKKETAWEPQWGIKRVIGFIVGTLFVPPALLIYIVYRVKKSTDEYREILGIIRPTVKQVVVSVVVGTALFFVSWCLLILFSLNGITPPDSSSTERFIKTYFEIAILLWVITGPIVEEIVFSGYVYPVVRTKYGVKPGILGVALLFAVLHLELVMVPILFVGAVIKLYAYERTHCLYVPVLIHFIYNLVVVLLTSLL